VAGYVRGPPFNPNKMIHIQGWGDFRLSRIEVEADSRQAARTLLSDPSVVGSNPPMVIDDGEMEISDVG